MRDLHSQGRSHFARSTWSRWICLPGSPILWGKGFHFSRWRPHFPLPPPKKLHLDSVWLWPCLWTLCLGFPVFTTRKNCWVPARDYQRQAANPCCKSRLKLQFIDFSPNLQNSPTSKATLILPRHKWSHYCLHCGGDTWSFASDFKTCFLKWSTHFESNFLLFLPNWMPFSAEKLI